jgi:CBS domain-containing protein
MVKKAGIMTSGSSTTFANQLLKDIMTPHVSTITSTATICEAAQTMKHLNVGALLVCDGARLQGMLTDRDIVMRVVAEQRNAADLKVRDAMSSKVTYCYEDQTVDEAVRVMADRQIRRLAILNREENVVGILSLGDVAVRSNERTAAGKALEGISKPKQSESPPRTAMDGSIDPQP